MWVHIRKDQTLLPQCVTSHVVISLDQTSDHGPCCFDSRDRNVHAGIKHSCFLPPMPSRSYGSLKKLAVLRAYGLSNALTQWFYCSDVLSLHPHLPEYQASTPPLPTPLTLDCTHRISYPFSPDIDPHTTSFSDSFDDSEDVHTSGTKFIPEYTVSLKV